MTDRFASDVSTAAEGASRECCAGSESSTAAVPASIVPNGVTEANYTVSGMTCGHCVAAVSTEIEKLPGVSDVHVELGTGVVVVTSAAPLANTDIEDAVHEAGYELCLPPDQGGPNEHRGQAGSVHR
jgi:copper chaperone